MEYRIARSFALVLHSSAVTEDRTSMALAYNSLASGYRLEVTEIRPRLLSSSMRDSFSEALDGEAVRTSLCGENGDEEDKFMMR